MNASSPTSASSLPRYSRIAGTGGYLPLNRVTNAQLADRLAAAGVETSDEWITERTGIKFRHIAGPDETTSTLAIDAARAALDAAGLAGSDIDLIVLATATPDNTFPATATKVQAAIGMTGGNEADLAFPEAMIAAAEIAFDVVQYPPETRFLTTAKGLGKRIITGTEVATIQALEQFVLYTGVRPSAEQVRVAAEYAYSSG